MGWGTGNLGGGSGGLNFKIVSYATESELLADTPKENTIGVITSIPITGYHFGTEEPSPAVAGMVWITTGKSSNVEFNALKKNGIQVYPISAKQYVSGALVDRTAKSYQGGEWVDWVTYLFKDGDEFIDITGGWTNNGYSFDGIPCGGVVNSNGQLQFTYVSGNTYAGGGTSKKIDLTAFKTLRFIGAETANSPTTMFVGIYDAKNVNKPIASKSVPHNQRFDLSIDLSSYPGSYYIGTSVAGYLEEVVLET